MKSKFLIATTCCMLSFSFFSCGGGGGSDIVDSLIPDLEFTWVNNGNTDETFFFNVASQGAATSAFTGTDNVSATKADHFSGSYTNSKINFTYSDGSKKGQKYSGTIKGTAPASTMTLTTPTGTIVLQQHD